MDAKDPAPLSGCWLNYLRAVEAAERPTAGPVALKEVKRLPDLDAYGLSRTIRGLWECGFIVLEGDTVALTAKGRNELTRSSNWQGGINTGVKRAAEEQQTMSEKPGKRLVSKGKYVWVISTRTALGSMSPLCYIVGGITLLVVVAMLWFGVRSDVVLSGLGLPLCLLSTVLLVVAYNLSKTKKRIDSVTPITRSTIGLIPAKEILVRPSDQ